MPRLALAAYTPYKGPKDALGYATAFWTDRDPARRTPPGRPWVSHVEVALLDEDGGPAGLEAALCYSSSLRDGGVRRKTINLARPHWRVIPITWRDPDAALRVFARHAGEPYSYADLIAQHVLRLPVDFRGPTCSELAALMLGLPRAERIDPAWITDYCEMRRANHDP